MGYNLCPLLQWMETDPFQATSRKYICCCTERWKWPLGDTKLFWDLCFFPRPCALGGSAPGHTVSVLQLFSMQHKQHSCTKVRQMDKGNVQSAWKTKNLLSVVELRWDSLLVIWCTSIFLFFFLADFPFCAFSWFSKHFNQTWVNFYYVQVQRNSCGKWHTISYCPCTITPDEWTLYLVTWGFSPLSLYMAKMKILKK